MWAVALSFLLPAAALAQGAEPPPRIIVVPYPGEADAGMQAPPPNWETTTPTPPPDNTWPPPDAPIEQLPPPMPPDEPLESRTLEAQTPRGPLPDDPNATVPPDAALPPPPGAFLDGQPREGAFLSGPGSLTFVMHHSIMGGLGLLSTQLAPRLVDANAAGNANISTDQNARVAYLAGTLIGAGVGFGASAWWQFEHWMSTSTANFGIINSLIGGMFLAGMTHAFTDDATGISWMSFIGMEVGAWATAMIGGGQLPLNHGLLVASGGLWAAIYTALLLAIVATTGGGNNLRAGLDALLITPAIGAGAMAAATLKFNPSSLQIMRANIFGVGVGAAVLVLAALVLGPTTGFANPVPYVLAGVGAIGAKTVVSLLWAEAAATPPAPQAFGPSRRQRLGDVLW